MPVRRLILGALGFAVAAVLAVLLGGTGTTDPGPPTGEWADPGRTATQVQADYERRGVPLDYVACGNGDAADQQRCWVIRDHEVRARLLVHLDLVTHAITVRPQP